MLQCCNKHYTQCILEFTVSLSFHLGFNIYFTLQIYEIFSMNQKNVELFLLLSYKCITFADRRIAQEARPLERFSLFILLDFNLLHLSG